MTAPQTVVAIRELTARLMAMEQVVLATLDPKQRERYWRQVEENRKALRLPPLNPRAEDPLGDLLSAATDV